MLRNTKIIIASLFGIIIISTFFYFSVFRKEKKVEINLSQNSKEQEAIEENGANQVEVASEIEEVKNDPIESEDKSQPVESEKNGEVVEKTVVKEDSTESEIVKLSITKRLVSWGFQEAKNRKIDTIIIHSSYDALGSEPYSVDGVIAEYKSYGVSPHYLIDRKGKVYQLALDANIAYHAGESKMPDGRKGVNNFSLGIEMLTTKKDKLTSEQYSALKLLIASLKGRYKITAVLGHNQIAPGRKDDPWNFEWSKLK